MPEVDLIEEPITALPEYGCVPISFEVRSVFDVQLLDGGLAGIRLSEQPVETPWVKDYDACRSEGPTSWAKRWDISKWGLISAFVNKSRVGGCVIAYDTPGVHKLDGRTDVAALWDLRVTPHSRGQGIGSRLVVASMAWAKRRGCRVLKVETQNINAPACRLYAKQGFTLGSVNRYAYPEFPDEVELIWVREL